MARDPSSPRVPRRFAPLGATASPSNLPRLKGIVFDVDGTLCEPQNYMFREMRSALGIPKSVDILEHIYALPSAAERDAAMAKIIAIEQSAMAKQRPQPGLTTLMSYLDSRNLRKAICTRNLDGPVTHLLTTFLPGHSFFPIITRAFRPPKPDPAGILQIAREWAIEPNERGAGLIMVGDSVDDMTAGRRAGAATVLLVNSENEELARHENTDLVIQRLDDLVEVLERGFVSREGDV